MIYEGCKWLDKKKRKEDFCGLTFTELQKRWRMENRDNKLNKWGTIKFKQWRNLMIHID